MSVVFPRSRAGAAPRAALAAACLWAVAAASASAQLPLPGPDAVFPEDFGAIQTVREMPDGTVLVADPLGRALYRVDLDRGVRTVVGREGQGPDEYGQPDAVWPLPGDSTLLVDLGNGRLVALGPDLTFGPTVPLAQGDPRTGMVLALPQAVDAQGFLYVRDMRLRQQTDSAHILKIDRATGEAVPVATFKIEDRKVTELGSGNNRNVQVSLLPLTPQDAWGVAPDGTLVIARAGDYHLEWIAPDGTVTRGPAVPLRPVRVRTAEKEEWLRESGQSGGGVSVAVSIENGAVRTTFMRGGPASTRREIDQYEWPETKPPIYGGRVLVDPLGRAWVRRHVEAGDSTTYDLFHRNGRRVATYTLANGKRVVSFGKESVYVVAFDDFDLAYLERYPLPAN